MACMEEGGGGGGGGDERGRRREEKRRGEVSGEVQPNKNLHRHHLRHVFESLCMFGELSLVNLRLAHFPVSTRENSHYQF